MIDYLLAHGANVNSQENYWKKTPLILAASLENEASRKPIVEKLIAYGILVLFMY